MATEQSGPRTAARARSEPRGWASWAWAGAPALTLGLGTWAVFLYAAIRRRSAWLGGAAAAYGGALAVSLILLGPANPGPVAAGTGTLALIGCMLGGSAHALAVRRRVFTRPAPPPDEPLRRAEAAGIARRKLRQEARALAARDPALARELGIGRPDLRRDYDDGGLVDVNKAPAEVLATLPGMTAELAAKAVALRGSRGAFVSADDLSDAFGLPPAQVPDLAEKTLYLS